MSDLLTPSEDYRTSFLEGATEFLAEKRLDSTYAVYLGYDLKKLERRFDQFLRDLTALNHPRPIDNGWYVARVLWLIDGGQYIGQASVRPELCTDYLITYGGHIGYSIRPSQRRRGYGKKILDLALDVSREMGLKRVLITCDSDNVASRKIIEHNDGTYESSMKMTGRAFRAEGRKPTREVSKLRYWIDLKSVGNGKPSRSRSQPPPALHL